MPPLQYILPQRLDPPQKSPTNSSSVPPVPILNRTPVEFKLNTEETYKNLLLTEHALRSQYIELQRSRRQGLLFLGGVVTVATLLTYRVRNTTSQYFFLRLMEQLLMIALYITVGLFFLTGMYTKTFRTAPQFLSDTNRGLKSLNFRLVKTRVSLWGKIVRLVYDPVYAADPAGPVKIVLSPRAFSLDYLEEWELFRDEYWVRQRRRKRRVKQKRRKGEKGDKAERSEKPPKI